MGAGGGRALFVRINWLVPGADSTNMDLLHECPAPHNSRDNITNPRDRRVPIHRYCSSNNTQTRYIGLWSHLQENNVTVRRERKRFNKKKKSCSLSFIKSC